MDALVHHNGSIVQASQARVASTTAGLLYGIGVWTTLRIYEGLPFAVDRHWSRLEAHAEKLRIALPIDFKRARSAIVELIAANSVLQGRARITLAKGQVGAWKQAAGPESELLIFTASEAPPKPPELAITISPQRILSHSAVAGVKRTSMVENLLALEEARSRGFAEAIMLNERGEVVGATSANVFWVEAGQLVTPSIATGCIAGITRGLVIEIARKIRLHLVEGGYPLQRLIEATEVFFTSTAREVAPVSSFDLKNYSKDPGRITSIISREFQKLIRNARITT
jgi:branched-chain amino acid aminotransferase